MQKMEINHAELIDRIKMHYKANEKGLKLNMHLWGAMGIGKSYTVRAAGKELAQQFNLEYSESPKDSQGDEKKFVVTDIRAAQLEPTDVLGLPDLSGDYVDWKPPRMLPVRGRGIVLLDEMNRAVDTIRSSF